ncbi:MOB kinase activator-like 1A (Mob1 homolog 1A) (Mps one binder kinase activator-like 1A), partial [Durusdinium trenchii]
KRSTRGTFVEMKHANQKRNDLSKITKRTLGAGDLRAAVRLPKGESLNEWVATNIVDFYNEVSVLYDICAEDATRFDKPGEGFPPNFEYRWADGVKHTSPLRCSSQEYVSFVLDWIEEQIRDESVFIVAEDDEFPDEFDDIARKILTRIFRIYAIMYHSHFAVIEEHNAAHHLNTAFKHFVFFSYEHGMVEDKEYQALEGPVSRLIDEYNSK